MTSGVKTLEQTASGAQSAAGMPGSEAIPAALDAHGTTFHTRRGQNLPLRFDGGEAVFFVRSGVLMLHLSLPQGLRPVVAILYPGDVLRSAFAPANAAARLSAVSAGQVSRLRWSAFTALAARDREIAAYFEDAVAKQTARQTIHLAAIGRFDCRQRLATHLTELVLRTGVHAPCGGLAFDMPLSRTDMASYLGLNADTLSRTMSRLRSSGLLSQTERHRAVVRDFAALAALSPAAPALMALCGKTDGGPQPYTSG